MVDPRAEPDGHIEQKNLPGVLTPVIRNERKDGVQNRVERSEIVPPNRITKSLRTRLPEPIGRCATMCKNTPGCDSFTHVAGIDDDQVDTCHFFSGSTNQNTSQGDGALFVDAFFKQQP